MIRSFANTLTEQIWRRERVKRLSLEFARQAHRKLLILHRAANVNDLRIPPGNRLEKLSGDRAGQHSIRINGQFRICFRWTADGPEDVEIVDYH